MRRRNNAALLLFFLLTTLVLLRTDFLGAFPLGRPAPQGLKPALFQFQNGTLRLRSGQALEAVPYPKHALTKPLIRSVLAKLLPVSLAAHYNLCVTMQK